MWVVPGRREEVWTLLLLLLEVEVMEEGSGRDGSFQLPPLRLSVSVTKSSVRSTGVQNPESTRPRVLSDAHSPPAVSVPTEHPESLESPTV